MVFGANNQDGNNNIEIVAHLLGESGFQVKKEHNLNNDVSVIYVHKILLVVSSCIITFWVVFVRKDFIQVFLSCAWEAAGKDLDKNSVLIAINAHMVDLFPSKQTNSLWWKETQENTSQLVCFFYFV